MEWITTILRDQMWGGIGAIAGLVSIVVTLWLASREKTQPELFRNGNLKGVFITLSLILPAYSISVFSVLFVNGLTKDQNQVINGSAGLATMLSLIWGIIWRTYLVGFGSSTNNRKKSRSTRANRG